MQRLIITLLLIAFLSINHVYLESLRIPLIRQNLPRESATNFELNKDNGVFPGYFAQILPKPKPPKPPNGTVALYKYMDSEFYSIITVAHQEMFVIFDTTWEHSWLISEACPAKVIGCWFHNRYDHANSATYVANGTEFSTNEKNNNITGFFSYEKFVIGQQEVDKQLFIEVTDLPFYNVFNKADGVIGLGLKYGDDNPWFYNVLANKIIKKALFSIYINRDKQSKKGGAIILGAIDKKHIHHQVIDNEIVYDDITYVPVESSYGYWEFTMDWAEIKIAKNNGTTICEKNCKVMPDSSNNNIIVPKGVADKIHKQIGAKHLLFGVYEVKCDTIMKLPKLVFQINGKNFTLKGEHYTQKLTIRDSFTLCLSSIRAAQTPEEESTWILGGAFLAQYYSIFDVINKRIGFVRAY